ncbi:mechanosensitive ion channel [Methylophaga sp. OBS1]|uniref:mechanosensitive ion channel n=1 Tax=Methylophaga sp. OBS1 TaxID=2991933 RepID=UPI002252A568|nr:mechanosensitive ion channel [Methylophaga sp. OBS1]MCX4192383.1 mechanosensitive ion channel [Methylophaga sp. OBS1]
MNEIVGFWSQYESSVLQFLVAVLYLIGFYIVARVVKSVSHRLLIKTQLDNRFTKTVGLSENFPIEKVLSVTAFWLIMVFGLVTFFDMLELESVTQPLNALLTEIFIYLPKLGAAAGLLIIAWILASLLEKGIEKASSMAKLDERLNKLEKESEEQLSVSKSFSRAGYWLVFLLFLPMVLGVLQMESLVTPLQDMFAKLFSYLPNIISAALIFAVGYFVARLVKQIVTSLSAAAGIDKFSERVGLENKFSSLLGTVVYTFILLLVIVQSLDALKIAAVSMPAQNMIQMIFAAIPGILAAALVIGISYYIGKLVAQLVTDLLTASGFNKVISNLGFEMKTERTPSQYAGNLVLLGVILFAVLGATELLNFDPLSQLVTAMIEFAVQVILAAVILAVGIFVAKKVKSLITEAGLPNAAASLASVAILFLTIAMALRQLGLAQDIINIAFGLMLGAVAVGTALAIGLGSKDIAGREVEAMLEKLRK